MTNTISQKGETSNSYIEYIDNIVFITLKEDVEITIESMKEQYIEQDKLVGNDEYAVCVDITLNSSAPPETRTFMAQYNPPNRIATALVSDLNIATQLMANFYLRFNKPKGATKLFKDKDKAIEWLKSRLRNTINN